MADMRLILSCLCIFYMYTVVYASYKKGAAISHNHYHCGDTDAFTNVNWWYDWQQEPKYHTKQHCTNTLKLRGRVPMVWGWRSFDHPVYFSNNTSQYVLGFNEPNHKHQSNLTAEEAAKAWKEIQARADRQNQLLVGPSATRCHNHDRCIMDGTQWYTEFFRHCTGCRVDYIATHAYGCNADTTMNYLKELWDHFHKPIWLTEFACPSNNVDHILAFMKEILPRLESAGYVARYSWFASRVAGTGAAHSQDSLLHTSSSSLTTLGNYYNNFIH